MNRRRNLRFFAVIWAFFALCSVTGMLPALPGPARTLNPIPARPSGRLMDLAQVFDTKTAGQLAQAGGDRVTVVTVKSVSQYNDPSIEALARRWHQAWQLGDGGILLLLSPADRKARIELGPGYSGDTLATTDSIMSATIVPACKENEYDRALIEGTRLLAGVPAPSGRPAGGGGTLWQVILLTLAGGLAWLGFKRFEGPTERALLVGLAGFLVTYAFFDGPPVTVYLLLWSGVLMAAVFQPDQKDSRLAAGVATSLLLAMPAGLKFALMGLGASVALLAVPVLVIVKLLSSGALTLGSSSDDSSSSGSDWGSDSSSSGSSDYSSSSYDSGGSSSSYDSGGGGSSDSGSTGSW